MKPNNEKTREKALHGILERSSTDGDVAVRGTISSREAGVDSEEALLRTRRILDRLLWIAFTKRGRHEKNVR